MSGLRASPALAIAAWLLLAPAASAQNLPPADGPELESYCRSTECRRDVVTQVRLLDGRIQEESKPLHRPAITRSSISVLLGEELQAVPEFDGQIFLGWRAPERRESSRTPVLTFKLNQESDGSISVGISNVGPDPVKLRMYIRTPGAREGEYTSSCPVLAGGAVFEYWSRPVIEVIIQEAALLRDAALLCD